MYVCMGPWAGGGLRAPREVRPSPYGTPNKPAEFGCTSKGHLCSGGQGDVVVDGIVGQLPRLLQHLERRLPLVLVLEVALGRVDGLS